MTQPSEVEFDASTKEKLTKNQSGWWFVLLALPFGFFFQIGLTISLDRTAQGVSDALMIIVTFILLRAIIGLIWQPQSRDWKWYLAFLSLSVPLIWFLGAVGNVWSPYFVTSV